nr:AAA family ATPase [Petropleomorpha daqingensis]
MLERDVETAALDRHLTSVRAGAGCTVLVDGPAGIGKSSLLAHTAELAGSRGFRVLSARGAPLESSAGWGIARQLLGPVLRSPDWEGLAVGAAALARRVLEPDPDLPPLRGDAAHAAAYGLSWLVAGLADRSPTVLVVDDVHWADAPSLRWLVQLTGQLADLPLAVLCAVRTGEEPADADVLTQLLLAVPAAPIRPRPLGPDAVAELVRERLPDAGPAFVRACHEVTGGNPFLLHALLDHLLAEGLAPSADVATTLTAFGPEQVARSVRQQLARLPAGAGELAIAFAVLGRDAPLRQAGALAGLAPPVALRLADQLRATGLLVAEGGQYAFAHPLVMGALYNALPPGERGLRHGAAARLLEYERADPELVALHLLHTEPFGELATVGRLRIAADHATARGAPDSAVVFLRRALAEPPDSRAAEADLRSELGQALAARLSPESLEQLSQAVALADTPDQQARIALAAGRALAFAGHFEAAIAVCRSGLATGTTPALAIRLEAELVGVALLQSWTAEEARERVRAASPETGATWLWRILAGWQAAADARPAAEALDHLYAALQDDGTFPEADTILGSCAKIAFITCGDLATAEALCAGLIDVARPRGWLIALAHGSFMRAIAYVHAGRVREAETDARLSWEYKLHSSPLPALMWSVFPLVDALTELDDPTGADAVLVRTGLLGDPPAGALAGAVLLESRARLRLTQGRPAEAHADAAQAGRRWAELGFAHPALAAWRVVDAEALVALGDRAGARRLAVEHLELAARVGLPEPRGAGLRALARAADRDEAVGLLQQAVAVLADSPAQLEHVRALVDLGTALARTGCREQASDVLRRALDLADRGGLQRLARLSRDELHACGARPRRTAVSGVESLTPAEHRVAVLAARGLSNPEIAQELYVTRRTVETHLTHVFQKLCIPTRSELPAQLQGRVLDPSVVSRA